MLGCSFSRLQILWLWLQSKILGTRSSQSNISLQPFPSNSHPTSIALVVLNTSLLFSSYCAVHPISLEPISESLRIAILMAKLFPEGIYPGQESVLSLRCQIERNKCQCRCWNLSPCKLTLSLCILSTLFRAFQHLLCHVDWRMAVHLLTMPLQRHALRVFIFHQLCWVEQMDPQGLWQEPFPSVSACSCKPQWSNNILSRTAKSFFQFSIE